MSVLQIGPYRLSSQVVLAPMAGTSDKPFRQLCRAQGAALTPSEMVVMQAHLRASNKSKYRLDFAGERAPVSVQIAGAQADMLAQSARSAVALGADIIDINMGCPAKKVCHKLAGSALMQNEPLVAQILRAVVEAVSVPVTLKMRTGWSESHKNAPRIAQIAQSAGIQMLSIHGRTRTAKYTGDAEYATIRQVVREVDIPVLANGDIASANKARRVLDYTGAAGVMVGRATQGNPWIIRQIDTYLKTGKCASQPTLSEKKRTILRHIQQIYQFYGDFLGLRIARKHIFWYLKNFESQHRAHFWQNINRITDQKQQFDLLHDYLRTL